jgi:hypothetical protein
VRRNSSIVIESLMSAFLMMREKSHHLIQSELTQQSEDLKKRIAERNEKKRVKSISKSNRLSLKSKSSANISALASGDHKNPEK